jgi:hypothetical protein
MSDIHVHVTEGEQSVYPEEQIPELLRQGILTPDTYYWREGMPQWKRLSGFRPAAQAVVPERRTAPLPDLAERPPRPQSEPPPPRDLGSVAPSRRYRFRRKPEPLTTILRVVLAFCFLITLAELALISLGYHAGWGKAPLPDGAPDNQNLAQLLEWAGLGLDLILLVLYCAWVYRTNLNCRNFSPALTFSAKWAVGCHFIPVMNLIRPYQAIQEIWKVSDNPRSWHSDPPSILVGIWWMLWLLILGLAETSYLLAEWAETSADWTNVNLVFIGLKGLELAWFGLFLAVITVIMRKQNYLVNSGQSPSMK